jgi:hypothetical protein
MHCTRDRIGGDRFFRIYCHHARMDTRITFFTLNTRCTPTCSQQALATQCQHPCARLLRVALTAGLPY